MSKPKIESIERQRGVLWSLGLVLVASLCAALILLSWASVEEPTTFEAFQERWPQLVGLAGLVLLFVLHATKKQRELRGMQVQLHDMALREASLHARLGELSFLFDTSTQLQLRLDERSMLELATQRLIACFEAHQSSIMMLNEATGMLEVRAASGVDANLVAGSVAKPGEGIAGFVFQSGEALLLTPGVMAERFKNNVKPGRSISSSLIVPMRYKGEPVGVVNVCRTDACEEFTAVHVQMLESFAEHCAASFVNALKTQTLIEDVHKAA